MRSSGVHRYPNLSPSVPCTVVAGYSKEAGVVVLRRSSASAETRQGVRCRAGVLCRSCVVVVLVVLVRFRCGVGRLRCSQRLVDVVVCLISLLL